MQIRRGLRHMAAICACGTPRVLRSDTAMMQQHLMLKLCKADKAMERKLPRLWLYTQSALSQMLHTQMTKGLHHLPQLPSITAQSAQQQFLVLLIQTIKALVVNSMIRQEQTMVRSCWAICSFEQWEQHQSQLPMVTMAPVPAKLLCRMFHKSSHICCSNICPLMTHKHVSSC